jgi:hypothetical protein
VAGGLDHASIRHEPGDEGGGAEPGAAPQQDEDTHGREQGEVEEVGERD